MSRVFNFSAGPAALPLEVLEQVRDEMLDWRGEGMSVMEMSHRGKAFVGIAAAGRGRPARAAGRPGQLQGAVPAGRRHRAVRRDPDEPGAARRGGRLRQHRRLVEEGDRRGEALLQGERRRRRAAASTATIPARADWKLTPGAAYVHYTPNETIGGVEFHVRSRRRRRAAGRRHVLDDPLAPDRRQPLRPDLRRRAEEHRAGRPGRRDRPRGPDRPARARTCRPCSTTQAMAADGSMLNTPPTYSWYIAGLVFQWLKRQGGLAAMERAQPRKAEKLYAAIDGSGFYKQPGRARRPLLDERAVHAAERRARQDVPRGGQGRRASSTLEGHRSVGGMRASIYNAMPMAGVEALVRSSWQELRSARQRRELDIDACPSRS